MVHLTVLLSICFVVQSIGCLRLRKGVLKKNGDRDTIELATVVRKSAGYIVLGLVIQLVVIISQIVVYFLFARV